MICEESVIHASKDRTSLGFFLLRFFSWSFFCWRAGACFLFCFAVCIRWHRVSSWFWLGFVLILTAVFIRLLLVTFALFFCGWWTLNLFNGQTIFGVWCFVLLGWVFISWFLRLGTKGWLLGTATCTCEHLRNFLHLLLRWLLRRQILLWSCIICGLRQKWRRSWQILIVLLELYHCSLGLLTVHGTATSLRLQTLQILLLLLSLCSRIRIYSLPCLVSAVLLKIVRSRLFNLVLRW